MARVPDESDFRSRPGKRGSRPRTKQRPEHADAVTGFVTGVDRGRYTLLVGGTDDGTVVGAEDERTVLAMKARELGRTRIVCGDRVDLVGDVTGDDGSLARIVRIQERSSVLRRTADDTDPYERVIVANADQLVVVTALAEPEPRTRMIDRCVVAAYDAGMDVLLCLTKADLADPAPLRALYEPLGGSVGLARRAPDGGGEQPHGPEAARERQRGERGAERDARGDADRRLERRRHDDGQPHLLGEIEARAHAAERLHLEHHDVGRVRAHDGERVLGAPDRLVRGDGHGGVAALAAPHGRETGHVGARLLDVLEAARRAVEVREAAQRLLGLPGAVRVDAHPTARAERVAHGLEARDLGSEGFERAVGPALRDLDLGGAAPAGRGDELPGAVRSDRRDGDVHGDPVADGGGPAVVGRLVRGAQPGGGLGVVVVPEGRELAPAGVSAQEDAVARVEPAEPGGESGAVDDGAGVGHAPRLCHASSSARGTGTAAAGGAHALTSTTTTSATITALNANATTACVVTIRRVTGSSTVTSAVEKVVLTPAARYT